MSVEFTAVLNTDDTNATWDIFLDGERVYFGLSTDDLSRFATDLILSNTENDLHL